VYECVRSGRLDEAERYCEEHDESWRIASIHGGQAWGIEAEEGGEISVERRIEIGANAFLMRRCGHGQWPTRTKSNRERATRSVEEDLQSYSE
jgi:hypothetical protein